MKNFIILPILITILMIYLLQIMKFFMITEKKSKQRKTCIHYERVKASLCFI